jgi:hypothetical protein
MSISFWRNSPNLGAGLDLIACETRQPAVTGTVNNPVHEDIQQGEFKFLRIESPEAFDDALNIGTGTGTGTAGQSTLLPSGRKLEFKKHFRCSSQATFCVLRVLGMNAYQRLQTPAFTRDARDLLKNGGRKAFREQFGDGFLSGQLTGIEFFGVIRIEANTAERQLELAAQLQASCEMDQAVVSTTFKERLCSAEHRISMAAYQRGGLVSVCDSPGDLMAMASDAMDDWRHQKGYPFATEVDPYHALGSPADSSPFMNIEPARQCLASLARHAQHLETLLNDIDFVTRNLQWFEKPNLPELHLARRAVCNEIGKVNEHAKRCSDDPDNPQDYSPTCPPFEMPPRKLASSAVDVRKGALLRTQPRQENPAFFPAMKYIRAGNFEIR